MKERSRQVRINEMLEDVRKHLGNLKDDLKNDSMQKTELWNTYAKLEYAILLVKLDNNFETAGGFQYSKLDKTSEAEILELAINHLETGKKAFNAGNVKRAIDDLRKARDTLKFLVLKY